MKNWKAILGVAGVFGLGMIAGGLLTAGVVAKRLQQVTRGEPAFTAAEITRHAARRLDLDAGQRAELLVIVAETQQQLRAARAQAEPRVREVVATGLARTRQLLTPSQQAKFDALVAEQHARWRP